MMYIGYRAIIKCKACPRPIVRKVYEDGTGALYIMIMGRFVNLNRFKVNGFSYKLKHSHS